jgi:putative ABC transport system ATP-binding protein
LDKSLFRYIWRHSRVEQIIIFGVVLASLPFYFWSLDLPKRIVNEAIQGGAFKNGKTTATLFDVSFNLPSFLGGQKIHVFDGFTVGQVALLFGLSGLFLFLVLINGAFKYWINVAKGALGERMLRRLRFDLFALSLRFPPETLRTVKSSEVATMIKDEVEPVGGFIGDAFVQPVLLGSQALTAMAFILMQNLWLGIIAGGIVGVQFTVIPRLRRIQLALGKQRQIASRKLAGRVGEIVDGMEAVHVHDATAWERAEIGHRLYDLFDLRFRLYKWKFMVKFLNNILAQVTPFFFYAVGGYLALKGKLDIGQLVAVIAAYRELPPPLKELIDWDQQRLDVQIKYDQVVQQFTPDRLLPLDSGDGNGNGADAAIAGPLMVKELRVFDTHGTPQLDNVSFNVELPAHIALIGDGSPAPSALARVLSRRISDYGGLIAFGGSDLARMPASVIGRRMAYAGVEPVLFPGSLRDNLLYGLRRRPAMQNGEETLAERRRRTEAARTGNPTDNIELDWIDYAAAGATGPEDIDERLLDVLQLVGMRDNVYRFGLSGKVRPKRHPALAEKLVEARHRLRDKLAAGGMSALVEQFDPEGYNRQTTVGENLLFGVPVGPAFAGRGLAANPLMRKVLDAEHLTTELIRLGAEIAATMTEIFRDLPPGHSLFEQFSFIAADDVPEYEDIVRRWSMRGAQAMGQDDRTRLIALPLDYIEPRHRLGLLDDTMRTRIVAARHRFRKALSGSVWEKSLELYDPEHVCYAAPLRDNLLFGRIAHGVADAQARVTALGAAVIEELHLRRDVERVGLDYQIGPAGRLLSPLQRSSVYLARCLAKNPDVLVVDGVFVAWGDSQATRLLAALRERLRDRTLLAVLRDEAAADGFDAVIRFEGAKVVVSKGSKLDRIATADKEVRADTRAKSLVGEPR